jgi:Icc protein
MIPRRRGRRQRACHVAQIPGPINETVMWKGVPFITSGAVSGNWWHGTRMGTPEGFTVVRVEKGKLSTSYETYGFKSVAPQNG